MNLRRCRYWVETKTAVPRTFTPSRLHGRREGGVYGNEMSINKIFLHVSYVGIRIYTWSEARSFSCSERCFEVSLSDDESRKGQIRGQRPEHNIEDGAALRCRSDPGRNG